MQALRVVQIAAIRRTDDEGGFAHREKRRLLVPLSLTGIRHVALAASTEVARNESDLAAFVAASPLLSTMTTRFAETGATGRRADNRVRHECTNRDVARGQWFTWPEQHERVSEGSDRIVKSLPVAP